MAAEKAAAEEARGHLAQSARVDLMNYGSGRPMLPMIRWGAILAGVVVGISTQLALALLGIATGMSVAPTIDDEAMTTGPLVWAGISMLLSAFVGGYVAARMSGLKRKADGVLHGAVSWAVTTILFAVLATSFGGSLVSGVFNNMNQLARADAVNGMSNMNGTNGHGTLGSQSGRSGESQLSTLMREQAEKVDPDALRQLQRYVRNGQRDDAVQLVVRIFGLEPTRAEAIVDQALAMPGRAGTASTQGRTTDSVLQAPGATAWVVFLTVALALAVGIAGGAIGAAGSRRISWGSPA